MCPLVNISTNFSSAQCVQSMHNFNFSRYCQTAFLSGFKNLNSNQKSNTVLFVLALYFLSFLSKLFSWYLNVVFIFLKTLEFTYLDILFLKCLFKNLTHLFFILFTPIFICSIIPSLLIS